MLEMPRPGTPGVARPAGPAPGTGLTSGRQPTPPFQLGHRPALDGVRGIAIVLVVVYHLGQLLWLDARAWLLPGGFVGVDLFFALSGFLITALLLGELDRRGRIRVGTFIWRRILRLTPALAVALAALLVAALFSWVPHDPLVQAKKTAWTLLYLHIWTPQDHFPGPELGQTWSLAVEMHFYVLWSVTVAAVAMLTSRRTRVVLLALAVAAVLGVIATRALRLLDDQPPLLLFPNTPNRIDGPFVGVIGGIAYASGWLDRVRRPWPVVLGAVGFVGLAGIVATGDPLDDWYYLGGFTLAAVFGTCVVLGAALDDGPLTRALSWPPLTALGRASYSLFLWHMPVFIVLQREATTWPIPLRALVAILITAALATASYLWVERPIQRLRHRPPRPTPVVRIQAVTAAPVAATD